jgi:hypothetical protein
MFCKGQIDIPQTSQQALIWNCCKWKDDLITLSFIQTQSLGAQKLDPQGGGFQASLGIPREPVPTCLQNLQSPRDSIRP